MANSYDPREFTFLGQKIDSYCWWQGGALPEYVTVGGLYRRLWDNYIAWRHNVLEFPFFPCDTSKCFSLWKWFIDNCETLVGTDFESIEWSTNIDLYDIKYVFPFNSDGFIEDWTTQTATFFIGIVSPTRSTNFYIVMYDVPNGITLGYIDNVYAQFNGVIRSQQSYLNYQGFDPQQGLTTNDYGAGIVILAVPQPTFLPDVTSSYDIFETYDNPMCLIQNGMVHQIQENDVENGPHNDLSGAMSITNLESVISNMTGCNYGQEATSYSRTGYFPNVGFPDMYDRMYEYVQYSGSTELHSSIPWHELNTLPIGLFTIDTSDDDVEPSEEEGGDGEYIQDDDGQETNPLPDSGGSTSEGTYGTKGGATKTGMAHLYAPTEAQMKVISSALWSDDFVTNISKLFMDDPINSIISLGYLPVNLAEFRGSAVNFRVGASYELETPIFPLTVDYIHLNAGTITVKEKWGSALDFDPYSSAEVYLPFIGYVKVSLSDIINPGTTAQGGQSTASGKLSLTYKINCFTGDCVAQLYGVGVPQLKGEVSKKHLIGQYVGSCIEYIPFSGANYASYYRNQVQTLALGLGGAAAGLVSGNPMAAGLSTGASVMNAMSQIPQVQRSGGISGGSARLQYLKPFLRLTRPAQSLALSQPTSDILNQKGYKNLEGVACNFYVDKLDECVGYTQVETVELKGITATEEEAKEIEMLLKNGVFIGTGH